MTGTKQTSSMQPSMLSWSIIRKGLAYIFSGKLHVKQGHLPPAGHKIPDNFVGIGVASAADAGMDDYVIEQLNALAIKQVRLDFTYADLQGFNARFLDKLIANHFNVTLHLIQPFNSAKNMQDADEQSIWQTFLQNVLDRFGANISRIEIGSTINRKRWAGYTVDGFLAAWDIAYREIKQRNLQLAGPSVTDFEPIYNIGILDMLKAKNQLPDVHTNNLFSERVSEPERFDHRVFKYRWATAFKYNLIKKARLLKKVSTDFGIQHFISPVAFWAIYRIERLLTDGEQKQADYAARYMLLTAASGALDQVFWGALICHREGVINDGLNDAGYPALERVTHYASVDGNKQNFTRHASFFAMRTVAEIIQGAHYQGALATTSGLEIHHFETATHTIHALWTINGKLAFLNDIYNLNDLQQAEIMQRDGEIATTSMPIISESPMYLKWPANSNIATALQPKLAKDLAIHAHIQHLQYYPFRQNGWFGLILAKNVNEAALLGQQLNPAHLASPQKNNALRHARNAIWAVTDPRNVDQQVTIKQPVKMYAHKKLFDRFKPSKAKRSWNGAVELLRRGIDTAQPVAFFEKENDSSLKQNFYICDYVKADCCVGEMFIHFSKGNNTFSFAEKNQSISAADTYVQLANYLVKMHKSGVFFRDLSGGNVLVQIDANQQLHFSLIDTARACFYNFPTPMNARIADLVRICNKLDWQSREQLMTLYLAKFGLTFTSKFKRPFYLYDFKVNLKRKIGRKAINRLIKRFTSNA